MSLIILDPLIQFYSETLNIKPKITSLISRVIILHEMIRIYEIRLVLIQELMNYDSVQSLKISTLWLNRILTITKINKQLDADLKLGIDFMAPRRVRPCKRIVESGPDNIGLD